MEIWETERVYVDDLDLIIQVYKVPLKESGIISEEQEKTLFANVQEIENLNRSKVLAPLEKTFKEIEEKGGDMSTAQLGVIFSELSEHLKQYTEYCTNQPKALAMLDELDKGNPQFSEFNKNLTENNAAVRGLTLLSYIIKPVQRLCKYPLLLRELINQTDSSLDEHKSLSEAMSKLLETVDYVNVMQRKAEEVAAQKNEQIANLVATIEGIEELDLVGDPNRVIVMTGDAQRYLIKKKKFKARKIILFNNLVIITSPKKKLKQDKKKGVNIESKLDWHSKIADVTVVDLADNDEIPNMKNCFELKSRKISLSSSSSSTTDESVILTCEALNVKRDWIKHIKVLIKDHQKQEVARLKQKNSVGAGSAPRRSLTSVNFTAAASSSSGNINGSNNNNPSPPSSLSSSQNNGSRTPTPPSRTSSLLSASTPSLFGTESNNGNSISQRHLLTAQYFYNFPPPPPDDEVSNDDKISTTNNNNDHQYDPPYFPVPRCGDWLQYTDDVYKISYYYNIQSKESVWIKPEGWNLRLEKDGLSTTITTSISE
eukprot:TRINITY_DN2329_c0_g1_i2.p1 TRINITY_DN2329_c0_g1~~TRINITY_DN2329_c0_g1_i2.p1  ORF type:complete len:542 (+),score=169.19 TRINITY_DN2329_c0_g1_i2:146-1771(+)